MLGRLRMSVEECIEAYGRLGVKVFQNPKSPPHSHMYEAAKLEDAIKSVIEEKLGPENVDAPLLDPLGPDCCKTVVYTLPLLHPDSVQPTALRTYSSDIEPVTLCTTIWQAARATSAAPTFFAPLPLNQGSTVTHWIDAGLGFNNPSKVLRFEAGRLWGDDTQRLDYNAAIGCFLSLGTGLSSVVRLEATTLAERISARMQNPLAAIKVLQAIATGTEATHIEMSADFDYQRYHRFNVEQGLQDVQLFEYERLAAIWQDTEHYVSSCNKEMVGCIRQMTALKRTEELLAIRPEERDKVLGQVSDEDLQARMDALGITWEEYRKMCKRFEKRGSQRASAPHLFQLAHIFPAIVQADILEKHGRLIAAGLTDPDLSITKGVLSGVNTSTNPEVQLKRQIDAHERLRLSFNVFRVLYHETDLYWTSSSLEHCWVAARLGGILAIFGLRHEASLLLLKAYQARTAHLGADHKSTKELRQAIEALQPLI